MIRNGALLLAIIAMSGCSGDAPGNGTPGNAASADVVAEAGERMYRDGIHVSGEPMTALVGGDIPIVGTQFSCENCHGRSGMGAAEGPYVVPPVAGQFLFAPSPQPERPAYDRDSLAVLLRDGITPSGRALSPELMPRYEIGDADVDVLTAYLENLSPGNSPGVGDEQSRFATVVTEGADPDAAAAMLAVLDRYAEDINSQTRGERERWDRGYSPESKLPTVFREWVIDEWTLSGPRETWAQQLESYYSEAPVFALISGTGPGSWQPVSEFCERNKVACLYPSTELPHRNDGDFYTVYFSGGLLLEARLIAAHLAERPVKSVVQVYCDPVYESVVAELRDSLEDTSSHNVSFDCDRPLPIEHIDEIAGERSAVVLWVGAKQLEGVPDAIGAETLYVSSTLTDAWPPAGVAGDSDLFMAHPYRLPGKVDPAARRFRAWAKSRGVEITAPRLQAEAYFACLVLKDAVKQMGRFFIREFALDKLDHSESLAAFVPMYEQPSFGPGQRFISKGGYIVPVVEGQVETVEAQWLLP